LPNGLFNDKNMKDETRVLNLISIKAEITRGNIEALLGVKKTKATNILNKLINKNLIESHGTGKNIVYRKI
ncbi:MAG TPA: MarR family transcriptional regulator, partial [Acholeplasma sp.]|nr:MarR family transcriptional regulator [Acholeplasma sp.]